MIKFLWHFYELNQRGLDMKTKRSLIILVLALTAFAAGTQAQRKTTKKPAPKPTAASTSAAATVEIKAGAVKVGTQLNNVAKFNDFLCGIASGLEDMDAAAKKTPLKEPTLGTHKANKQRVIQGIRNLRAGLAALETEFQSSVNLRRFQFQISGISDLCGHSESLAAGGQFVESGRVLLQVIQKLSDTLVAMP
jgi:hypothetical protein